MLQRSVIGKVLLQLLGVGAYFALVVILYWRGLTDAGAVAIILGLLFLFKSVVDSGAISIGHLSPSDPVADCDTDVATDSQAPWTRIRKASRARAPDSPAPGEGRKPERPGRRRSWFVSSPSASFRVSLDSRWH
jgi:hypothetical protein